MAITTYTELQSAIENWLHRSDLSARIPEFIAIAEAKLNRKLRLRAMINTASGTVSSATIALPTGYLETKRLTIDIGSLGKNLRFMTDAQIAEKNTTGTPDWFTIEGDNIRLGLVPSGNTYTHVYWKKFDALSGITTTNWLLTNAPDVYLYAALMESAPFLNNDERAITWNLLLDKSIAELKSSDKAGEFGGSLEVMVA